MKYKTLLYVYFPSLMISFYFSTELWALVNNAGVIERGEIEWMPMESCMKQFEVNTFGVMRVTKAFLPLLRKSKGRVVTTTSTGGKNCRDDF